MDNAEIRARVLKEFYDQEMRGEFRAIEPETFAKSLGVPRRYVEVAMKYLVDMGLLRGHYVLGTDVPMLMGITALGLDVVDNPQKFRDVEINFQNIQVSGPVLGGITQAQGQSQVTQINSFSDLDRVIDATKLAPDKKLELKDALSQLKQELEKSQIDKSKISKLLSMFKEHAQLYPLILEMLMTKVFHG